MMTAAQPATEDPPEAPQAEDASETGDESEMAETSADEAEQTNTEAQLTAGRLAPVPNVNTYFDYVAVEALRSSGFQTRVVYEYRPGYLNTGVTWGTDPVGGTLLPAGSTVTVYSTPVDQPQIPTQPQGQPPLLGQPQGQPQIFQPQFPI